MYPPRIVNIVYTAKAGSAPQWLLLTFLCMCVPHCLLYTVAACDWPVAGSIGAAAIALVWYT